MPELKMKDMAISLLFDYYGDILTEKQKEAVNLYYNEDFSLAEIAEHTDVTRQGIRDRIIKSENILLEMEAKLGFAARFDKIRAILECIIDKLEKIKEENKSFDNIADIEESIKSAKDLLD